MLYTFTNINMNHYTKINSVFPLTPSLSPEKIARLPSFCREKFDLCKIIHRRCGVEWKQPHSSHFSSFTLVSTVLRELSNSLLSSLTVSVSSLVSYIMPLPLLPQIQSTER